MAKQAVKDSTAIKECSCSPDYQDKLYGKGKRLCNPNKIGFKCSVCGKPHSD